MHFIFRYTTMLKKFIYTSLMTLVLASCSESVMDDINKDEANPPVDIVDAKFQLTDAIVSTAFTTYGGPYAWYVSSYTEQSFGTGNNQLMKTELRQRTETAGSSTFNNEWNGTYANLYNIKYILEKCAEGGVNAGQSDIEGMAQVLWCLNFEALTDLHGDIPYSEALGVSKNPKLDKQADIYKDLCTRIDNAITLLTGAAAEGMNNAKGQDFLYGGDPAKWVGLAQAVKARLYLNQGFRDASAYATAKTAAEAAAAAGFSGAELSIFNGVDCDNSWTAYQWSRYYVGANKTVADLMEQREDPRLDIYAADMFGTGVACAPAGDADLAGQTEYVGFPVWLDNGAATIHVFSLSELYFILAETKARAGEDASADLTAAVEASFADYAAASGEEVSGADTYVAALGDATLDEVMVQKYIAQARDEVIQTYNDIRRFKAEGKSYVTLNNPNNERGGKNQWPLRLPYGNSDVVSNPNVAAAFGSGNNAGEYLFTENIWLFGGER